MVADLLRQEEYFHSIARDIRILVEISRWIEYVKVEEGQYIYKVGDVIDCFYVLLRG